MTQFGSTGTSIIGSKNVFAQTSGSNSPSYALYQNSDYGFSIEYPSNWSYNQDFSKSSYGFLTLTPNDNGNIAFQVIFIKDDTNFRGLQGQDYLNKMIFDLSNWCAAKTLDKSGFSCSDFKLLDSKVQTYHDGPAYSVAYSWTEKAKNGNVYTVYTGVQWIPDGDNRWVLDVIGTADKFSQYKDVISHMGDSFKLDNYKPPTSQPAESQTNQAASSNSVQQVIPNWVKNNAKWWSEGSLNDDDFVKGIQYLIQQGIIVVPTTQVSSQPSQGIPSWVKNNAKWWSEGQLGDSDFVQGIQYLVQNGIIIVTQITAQSQTAVTDQQGMVTFQIAGQDVQFRFADDTTGLPLSGLGVAFALDPKTQSVGTLLIVDPTKHYPLQIVVLTGSTSNSYVPTSWENYFIHYASAETKEKTVAVTIFEDPRTVGSLALVTFLPGVGAEVGDIANNLYESLALATKYADKKGWLPVSDFLEKHGYMTGTTTLEKANQEIHEDTLKGSVRDAIFLLGGSATGHMGTAILGATVGTTINTATTEMDISTVSGCDPQTEEIKWVQIGFTRIYSCTTNKAYGLLKYDPPSESDHVSLDLLSKANQGFGEKIQADKGQDVPVPADDYTVQVSAPGKNPATEDVTVTPQHTATIKTVLQPIPSNNVAVTPLTVHVSGGTCTVNQPCDIVIATATGGLAPYHFKSGTFANGTPPFGMTIGIYGHLTGTPIKAGYYTFGICAVDTAGKDECGITTVTVASGNQQGQSSQGCAGYSTCEDYCQGKYGSDYHYESSTNKCVSYGGYDSAESYCQGQYGSDYHYDSSQHLCVPSSSGGTTGGSVQQGGSALGIDLTGQWGGTARGTVIIAGDSNSPQLNCGFTGRVSLDLTQNDKALGGSVEVSNISLTGDGCDAAGFTTISDNLAATIFGSGFSGTLGPLTVNGQFTSDLMRGTYGGDESGYTINGDFTASRAR